jgi:hypothetical protein
MSVAIHEYATVRLRAPAADWQIQFGNSDTWSPVKKQPGVEALAAATETTAVTDSKAYLVSDAIVKGQVPVSPGAAEDFRA